MRKPTKRTSPARGTTADLASKTASAATPETSAPGSHGKDHAAKAGQRSEELRFKVTRSFKQAFKQTAKEFGLKKTALLEKLLADWRERHPAEPAGAGTAMTDSSAPKRRARAAGPARRGTTAPRRP